MITNAMVKTFDHNHDYHPHNHDYQPHNHDYHPYNYDYHPGPPTAWRELGNGGRAPHRVLRVANLSLSFIIMTTLTIIIIVVIILIIIISIDVIIIIIIIIRLLWLYYHHPIISIYHQCHHQTGPGSWLSPRSSLWHIINDQSINDWQYYCWANELWLSSSLPILVLSSLFSFSWAELRLLSSSCLKRWCVLPSRSLRTFALPDNQPLWKIHVTTLANTYNLFDKYILTTLSNTCHNFDKYI